MCDISVLNLQTMTIAPKVSLENDLIFKIVCCLEFLYKTIYKNKSSSQVWFLPAFPETDTYIVLILDTWTEYFFCLECRTGFRANTIFTQYESHVADVFVFSSECMYLYIWLRISKLYCSRQMRFVLEKTVAANTNRMVGLCPLEKSS